jgi:hypothetical protein
VLRVSHAPFVGIAKIRDRARGAAMSSFSPATCTSAAARRGLWAILKSVWVLRRGRGAPESLPRLVGRSPALEIARSGDDFSAHLAERCRWVNRTLDDAELKTFAEGLAQRLTAFNGQTLATIRAQVSRIGVPDAAEMGSIYKLIDAALT